VGSPFAAGIFATASTALTHAGGVGGTSVLAIKLSSIAVTSSFK